MSEEKNITTMEENTEAVETKATFKEKVQKFTEKHALGVKIVKICTLTAVSGAFGYSCGKKAGIKASQVQDIVEVILEETADSVQ